MKKKCVSVYFRLVAISIIFTAYGVVQTSAQSVRGADAAVTGSTGILGHRDAAAVAELAAHLAAVGTSPWVGMQGEGTITYGSDPVSLDIRLWTLGAESYRLDVHTSNGIESTRIHGMLGKVQESGGKMLTIPAVSAPVQLFPFQLPRTAHFLARNQSLIDHGLESIEGTTLHKITYEFASIGRNPISKAQQASAIDFYFDPTSHLLVKTASHILLGDRRPVTFLSVVTYSDYRRVGGTMVPFRYSETLDSQPYRTLQLSSVQLGPALSSAFFEF